MDSILRLKNILKNDNPLLKYIEHATPLIYLVSNLIQKISKKIIKIILD
jgi:hypothetical protein